MNVSISSYSFHGLLHEILIYDRSLSPEERGKVEAYLAAKYSLEP